MHTPIKVALAGAGGKLGPSILKELLEAGFLVTIITRKGSLSTQIFPPHPHQIIQEVDYTSQLSLISALNSIQVVISAVASDSVMTQKPLIDAAVAAGVRRFLPSEFGCDTTYPNSAKLPVYGAKVAIQQYLKDSAAAEPNFSYTLFCTNAFFDWGMKAGFLLDLKAHSAKIFDGGDRPFSATCLSTVGKGVVGVLKNIEITKNRTVYINDAVVTQNQIIGIAKRIDGKQWALTNVDTAELERASLAELSKESPDMKKAMVGNIYRACFAEGYGGDFTRKLDNDLLGVPTLADEDLETLIKTLM